jgi:hypothetical protein
VPSGDDSDVSWLDLKHLEDTEDPFADIDVGSPGAVASVGVVRLSRDPGPANLDLEEIWR